MIYGDKKIMMEVDSTQKEIWDYADKAFPLHFYAEDFEKIYDRTLPCHWHDSLEFMYIRSGEVDFQVNSSCCHIQAGQCVFVNSNTLHTVKATSNNVKTLGIVFSPSLLAKNMNSVIYQKYFKMIIEKSFVGAIISADNTLGAKIIDLFHEAYDLRLHKDDFGYELSCLSLICQIWKYSIEYFNEKNLLFYTEDQDRKHAETAKNILKYIHENYSENITIQNIAQACNVSKSECFRCFKQFTHKTPVEYINEFRLQKAENMLMETSLCITQICTLCGFSSCSYFTKLFKQQYLMTPTKYRTIHG